MADQSDVETALVSLLTATLYPQGSDQPSTIAATCRIYRGWPNAAALDADLAAGRVNLTVFPAPGPQRNTTRFPETWTGPPATPTLTVTTAGNSATFSGTAAAGQLAGLLVAGQSYAYRCQTGDTPALVAAALCAAIRTNRPALLSATTITVPGVSTLIARTAADTAMTQELRRQAQQFRISAWCPTPALRDATITAIDPVLAATAFLTLPDGSGARLRYASTANFDNLQDAALYRRDLIYDVEFPTTQSTMQPEMLFGSLGLDGINRSA